VSGVGRVKAEQYGDIFLSEISRYCGEHSLPMEVIERERIPDARAGRSTLDMARQTAHGMFARGASVEEVARAVERAPSTVLEYLISYIGREKLADPSPWVDEHTFVRIADAAASLETDLVDPIHHALGGEIGYDKIVIGLAVLKNREG